MPSAHSHFVGQYWVRPGWHRSLNLFRPPTLADRLPTERLIAALLREDPTAICTALDEFRQPDQIAHLLNYVCSSTDQIACLLFELACKMKLLDRFEQLRSADGDSLAHRLRLNAATALTSYGRSNDEFVMLLDALESLADEVIWIKGLGLARTIYTRPQMRLSRDFDLVLKPSSRAAVIDKLVAYGYCPKWDHPAYCEQFGVGPVGSLADLELAPHPEIETCRNISMLKMGASSIELKSDPLERGLWMKELSRFFADSQSVHWQGRTFRVPSLLDHLILGLAHLHRHSFDGWHWLYDSHLLVQRLNAEDPNFWTEFVRRCHCEGVHSSAWAALDLAQDLLATPVPEWVLEELEPKVPGCIARWVTFTVSGEFAWNSQSLPVLLANSYFLGDGKRKRDVLWSSFWPSKEFLCRYYARGEQLPWWKHAHCLVLHWLVLLMPAALIRHTFGKCLWKYDSTHAVT